MGKHAEQSSTSTARRPKRRWGITSEKFLSQEQINHLLKHLTEQRDLAIARGTNVPAIRDYYMIRGLLETGLRVFEFCSLINSDFSGHKLSVRRGKGGKARTVLLTKSTALMLREWTEVKSRIGHSAGLDAPLFPSRFDKTYTTRGVQKRVKRAFHTLGFPECLAVHSLRHTYTSLLLASGKVGIGTVRDNLGHHSIAVTNLYAHAIGNLDEVELYQAPSSQKEEYHELQQRLGGKKPKDLVTAFLRKANLK